MTTTYPATLDDVVDLGHRHFVRPCDSGRWFMWWHDCPAVAHISWAWIGDRGADGRSGHTINPLDVTGSLICRDCRDHGHIRAGRWVPL